MASTKEYLAFVLEQLADVEGISYRYMMGEYILYCQGRIFGGIYDNRLLLKPVPSAIASMPEAIYELPYEGAKPMLLAENVDDREELCRIVRMMLDELPIPKAKMKRKNTENNKKKS